MLTSLALATTPIHIPWGRAMSLHMVTVCLHSFLFTDPMRIRGHTIESIFSIFFSSVPVCIFSIRKGQLEMSCLALQESNRGRDTMPLLGLGLQKAKRNASPELRLSGSKRLGSLSHSVQRRQAGHSGPHTSVHYFI